MSVFLIDECVSAQTMDLIRSLGFAVETIQNLSKHGITDEEVMKLAQDKRATLVTYDRGFGDLARYAPASHSGIIVIRTQNAETLRRCHQVLQALLRAETHLEQTLFVVDHNKYRKRRA